MTMCARLVLAWPGLVLSVRGCGDKVQDAGFRGCEMNVHTSSRWVDDAQTLDAAKAC
jgi:hypothetical protein